jgi:hypothetical protein
MANSQHKATLRQILRSSLASKRGADELLDAVVELQEAFNALLAKMDADADLSATDWASTLEVTPAE